MIRINVGPTRRELRIGQRVRTCKIDKHSERSTQALESTLCVYIGENISTPFRLLGLLHIGLVQFG